MIVLSGALVLVALVLLVFGALDRNLPYVYASIGVSLLSLLLLLVGILQRRGELTAGDQDDTTAVTDTSDERVPALVGAGQEQDRLEDRTGELAVPAGAEQRPASRRVEPAAPAHDDEQPEQQAADVEDDLRDAGVDEEPFDVDDLDEPDDAALDDGELEDGELGDGDLEDGELEDGDLDDEGSGVTVLVVSGRPRYHLEGCRVLRGKEPQPLDRDDARTHGFTPCGVCKPDADETAAAATPSGAEQDGPSFAETIFGGPLFTDPPSEERDEPATSALPDRPVQPVLPDLEPATAGADELDGPEEPGDAPVEQADDPADADAPADADDPADADAVPVLQGDDPADDAGALGPVQAVEPAPDVAGDPDELPVALAEVEVEVAEPEDAADEDSTTEPVVEPVAAQDVPVDAATADEVPAAAPARARRTRSTTSGRPAATAEVAAETAPAAASRRRSGGTASGAAPEQAPRGTSAPATTAPAEKAPAKRAPAKKAPAKKAPAKKAPTRRTAAAEPAPPPVEPQVRRPVVRAVRADALRLGAPSTGAATTRVSVRAAAPVTSASVVVVPDRERFHRPECRFVRGVAGATALPKAAATRQGYVACGVCKP